MANDPKSSARTLKSVLRAYRSASLSPSPNAREAVNIPNELARWVEHRGHASDDPQVATMETFRFLAANARPDDVMATARALAASSKLPPDMDILPVLQVVLRRGLHLSDASELSGALVRLRRARTRVQPTGSQQDAIDEVSPQPSNQIWKRMSEGKLPAAG